MATKQFFFSAVFTLGMCFTGATAQSATLSGTFDVRVVNYSFERNQNRSVAVADANNFDARFNAAVDGVNRDTFTYTGELDFFVDNYPRDLDLETISDFLSSATSGTFAGLDATVGGRKLSAPTFRTTTLFEFTEVYSNAFDTRATHDDGFSIYDDGVELLSYSNPTGIRTTPRTGTVNFSGGEFKLIYAAANGNPSKLLVEGDGLPFDPIDNNDVPAVPLPAPALLLMGSLGALAVVRRRQSKKSSAQ